MKRTVIRIVLLVVLVGGVGALVAGKLLSGEGGAAASERKKGERAKLVTTYEVQPTDITDTFSAVGTLRPVESIGIRNEVPGKVVRIGFEEGERVEEGDMLIRMRSAPLRADLKIKKRRRDLLQTRVDRQRKVLEKGGISQQQFDETKNELEVVEAEIDKVRARLRETTVRAPFDGRIGIRDVSPGAVLTMGTRVAELVQTDPIEVAFEVPERYAGQIDEGTEVRFRVHGSSTIHRASIEVIESSYDAETRALPVLARADNEDGELRPGAYADVRAKLQTHEDVLVVPTPALVRSANETFVWLMADGKAEKRQVETGVRTESTVEITKGLSAGDRVVTTGRQALQPGVKLKVDDSEDAMDVEAIAPDSKRPGMRNKWFSDESFDDSKPNGGSGEDDSSAGSDGGGEEQ